MFAIDIKAKKTCYIKLADTWIILNSGGGPTPDKAEVLLEINRVSTSVNLRVADIRTCYMRDPDG